jgi:hypothetical protein
MSDYLSLPQIRHLRHLRRPALAYRPYREDTSEYLRRTFSHEYQDQTINDASIYGEEDFPLQAIAPPQALEPSQPLQFESDVPALIVQFYNLNAQATAQQDRNRIVHLRPSVRNLLNTGPEPCMTGLKTRDGKEIATANPDLRWIHLPANNMSWVEVRIPCCIEILIC